VTGPAERFRAYTFAERPELAERAVPSELVWPEYNLHGDVLNPLWGPLEAESPELQMYICDDADEVVAEAHTGAFYWDGSEASLPDGIDSTLVEIVRARREGAAVNTLSALAAVVRPEHRGKGLARAVLLFMRERADVNGLCGLVAPIRPTRKWLYPLAPIEEYVRWRRADGTAFDPWVRVHESLGARMAATLPHSMRITGTVSDWESWVGMPFPVTGRYVFPEGLAPLEVDREADVGSYWEPNVWMVHRDPAAGDRG
jgi:GNAT superfamily N-acetyltransferase